MFNKKLCLLFLGIGLLGVSCRKDPETISQATTVEKTADGVVIASTQKELADETAKEFGDLWDKYNGNMTAMSKGITDTSSVVAKSLKKQLRRILLPLLKEEYWQPLLIYPPNLERH